MINKPIKINRNNYRHIYFASDFHYNHQRDFIWIPRGFKTYQEHDKFLEDECAKLTKDDLLIYLGDFSLNSSEEQTLKLINLIPCQIYYVFGNHESVMSRMYKNALHYFLDDFSEKYHSHNNNFPKGTTVYPLSYDPNIVLQNKIESDLENNDVLYRGYYINPSSAGIDNKKHIVFFGEEADFEVNNMFYYCRHMAPLIWDKMKYPNYVSLCGHSHGNCSKINHTCRDGRILDVGVDNALKHSGRPFFNIDEINQIMKWKDVVIHDHHGDENI